MNDFLNNSKTYTVLNKVKTVLFVLAVICIIAGVGACY